MELTKSYLNAIFIQFDLRYKLAYQAQQPMWSKIASEAPSSARETHYGWLGKLPRLRKWVGPRIINNLQSRGYVLANDDYEETIGIEKNDILDDQIGVYNGYVDALGQQTKLWPDDMLTTAITSGTTATCFDGQPFFHNSHPVDMDNTGGATFQNNFDSSGTGGGVARPLTHANYALVRQTMMKYVGEDSKPLGITPKLLMVPPDLELQGRQILMAEMIAPSATLGAEAASGPQSNVLKGSADLLVNAYLTDAARWYLIDNTKPIMPFVVQIRQAPEFAFLNRPEDPNVFFDKQFIFGVQARGACGYSLPFLCASASG